MAANVTESGIIRYAQEHAASGWLDLEQADMLAVRRMIVSHLQGGPAQAASRLERRLFDASATLNRDWDLAAQTEVGECQLQGFIAGQTPGSWVKRMEAYQDGCDYCAGIQGLVCEVVSPNAPEKDWHTQVWFGKSRIHAVTAEAPAGDWPSAGLQHPGCRGTWTMASR